MYHFSNWNLFGKKLTHWDLNPKQLISELIHFVLIKQTSFQLPYYFGDKTTIILGLRTERMNQFLQTTNSAWYEIAENNKDTLFLLSPYRKRKKSYYMTLCLWCLSNLTSPILKAPQVKWSRGDSRQWLPSAWNLPQTNTSDRKEYWKILFLNSTKLTESNFRSRNNLIHFTSIWPYCWKAIAIRKQTAIINSHYAFFYL